MDIQYIVGRMVKEIKLRIRQGSSERDIHNNSASTTTSYLGRSNPIGIIQDDCSYRHQVQSKVVADRLHWSVLEQSHDGGHLYETTGGVCLAGIR